MFVLNCVHNFVRCHLNLVNRGRFDWLTANKTYLPITRQVRVYQHEKSWWEQRQVLFVRNSLPPCVPTVFVPFTHQLGFANFSLSCEGRFRAVSFECQKVCHLHSTTLHDWLKKLTPLFHPIRSKINRDSLARVFPHLTSSTGNYFELWLVHWILYVLCDWLEWLLWFWF